MTDKELINTISILREYIQKERLIKSEAKLDAFFVNAIEIACCLTELGITQKREISIEEKYWFEGSYHMNFWDSNIEEEYYTTLCREVEKREWFKSN